MVTVKIHKDKDIYTGYEIEGHAQYAESGKDIVCASISLIGQSTLVGLLKLDKVLWEIVMHGYMSIKIKEPNKETNLLMEILIDVANSIANQYPNNVKVEYIPQMFQDKSD